MSDADLPKLDRPPRIQPELPAGTVQIPKPPDLPDEGRARLVQIGLPLLTLVGYVLVSTVGGSSRNPLLIIPMAISVVASIGFGIYSYVSERRRRFAAERDYVERLSRLSDELRRAHEQQRRFYSYTYPGPETVLGMIQQAAEQARRPRPDQPTPRLWERRAEDADFGVVRLGIGTLPSFVVYELGDIDRAEPSLARAARKLAEDSRYVADVPVLLSLRPPPPDKQLPADPDGPPALPIPATHTLAIVGSTAATYPLARSIFAHFVGFHAHSDARLYLLAGSAGEWRWARDLPHCQPDENGPSVLLLDDRSDPENLPNEDGTPLERFLERLRRVLAQRKMRLQDRESQSGDGDPRSPHCLVVVDLHHSGSGKPPLAAIEADPAIGILLAEGTALGATVVFLVPDRAAAPSGCQAVLQVEEGGPGLTNQNDRRSTVLARYAETGLNSHRFVVEADVVLDHQQFRTTIAGLAGLDVRRHSGSSLKPLVSFLQLHEVASLPALKDVAWRQWQESVAGGGKAGWLRARLGLLADGKPRHVAFSARRDGVHALIAGSTGTGKSELLITMICALAVSYDPEILNFVLVDYKGGGTFGKFDRLPHVVDVITNLHDAAVSRMFTAIQAELQRRQELIGRANVADILEYHRAGHHRRPEHGPLPFLFVVIDEFAEMVGGRAEVREQLESVSRLGRSLGVSLILASQRPASMTDQMRANLKLRVCLRVEGPAESRELLRRSDAAFLPAGLQGRGYLQAGSDEIELIQIAYTGGPYYDPDAAPEEPVQWPGRPSFVFDPRQDREPPRLYEALIDSLGELAALHGRPRQMAPWPGFLPEQLALSQTLTSRDPAEPAITADRYLVGVEAITMGLPREEQLTLSPAVSRWLAGEPGWVEPFPWEPHGLCAVVGLVDDPQTARQQPLVIDLARGHACVFGASGWGKSTLLRTALLSLAASHSPNQLHIYALDLGGRALGALARLPHVGTVINPDAEGYEELVEQLIRQIEEQIEARKRLFGGVANDFLAYNRLNPGQQVPAIVVAVDNFLEFTATFGKQRDDVESLYERLIAVARQSRGFGIHLLISAAQPADLASQAFNLFTERFALVLSDQADYRTILGASVGAPAEIPGRGYVRVSGRPLIFQAALPIQPNLDAAGLPVDGVGELVRAMAEHVEQSASRGRLYALPRRIEKIPPTVPLRQILAGQYAIADGEPFWPTLSERVRDAWEASIDKDQAAWLRVGIGAMAGNQPRELQLEAKVDGVHALIAGGTGSGKSELLMSFILGLAMRYDPSVLNFVLVDYKGGGAFQPFKGRLPHVVDVITNLNKAAVRRVFTAIRAELNRRQKLSADSDGLDIVAYRRKGLHRGPNGKPYPHLVIIIDEFAEMITDNPEFSAELDSITRVGRSIGVNLVLASQRPIGVTDQMRANIKLRICLRVEGTDVSREMLRRVDAAFLPSIPGRGYLQVGNEAIELIQVAYAGEEATDAPPKESGERQRFFEAAIELAAGLVPPDELPQAPWPPMLPPALTFDTLMLGRYLPEPAAASPPLLPNPGDWLAGRGAWQPLPWSEGALRAAPGLLDDPVSARQHPLTLDLMRGHAAIYGAPGWGKSTALRALALSLAARYSPAELHLHALDLGGRALESLGRLPHLGTYITPERGYEERVRELWRQLQDALATRKSAFSAADVTSLAEYNHGATRPLPAMVVLIDNVPEFFETFGTAAQVDDPNGPIEVFLGLARQGRAFGLYFVITANRPAQVSGKIASLFTERLTLRLASSDEYSVVVGSGLGEIEPIPGRGAVRGPQGPLLFQVALVPGALDEQGRVRGEGQALRAIGEQMRARPEAGVNPPFAIGALENTFSYRDWLAHGLSLKHDSPAFLGQLKAQMQKRWAASVEPSTTDWLAVSLGLRSGNQPRTLRLKADVDGVHGLLAGGTGSGKSELLMTLIVGLALEHSPDVLNFVLVDYKGGGAFEPFRGLPHVVDVVTNLNKAGVNRVFAALDAELRRRMGLNTRTQTKDIVDYRRKGLHLGPSGEPFPHLFVIIDEYAEIIEQNPEFLPQLESITRVGRSIGVNLLLASQRPRKVTDQMRANIKLRICLRVEEHETSRELLRRPDAALLPSIPGRGYLQIGNSEIELVQVGYTGDQQLDPRDPAALHSGEPPRFYDAVVTLARELRDARMAPRPWPDVLPRLFSLAAPPPGVALSAAMAAWLDPLRPEGGWSAVAWGGGRPTVAVGLVDDPGNSRQFPLELAPARSHIALFGDSGSGKSSLLRTLAVGLAAAHPPDDVHIYGVDLGGRALRSLELLPQVGRVIYADDDRFEEQLQRLFEIVTDEADRRQQLISDRGVNGFAEFNARFPADALPLILLLIDNVADLRARFEAFLDSVLLPLARRSLSVGISLAVATNIPSAMPDRLFNLFGERLTLRQTDRDRYMEIVGRGAVELDEIGGRGYVRHDRRPLEFQAALPVGSFADGRPLRAEGDDLAELATRMKARLVDLRWRRPGPDPVEILDNTVPLAGLLEDTPPADGGPPLTVLGQNARLDRVLIDLSEVGPHMLIVGPPQSGKTTALRTLLLSLAERYEPSRARMVLVDLMQGRLFRYGEAQGLAALPHVLDVVDDPAQLPELIERLALACGRLAQDRRPLFLLIDGLEELVAEGGSQPVSALAALVRKYGGDGFHVVATSNGETASSDLRKRIMASGFGLGLRTGQAVDALRVMRLPPGLRDRELPRGRGYVVRNGQTELVQVATPYAAEAEQGRHGQAAALDGWVERVRRRHLGLPEAAWPDSPGTLSPAPRRDERLTRQMAELVGALARRELAQMQAGQPADAALIELLLDSQVWGDRARLSSLLRDEVRRYHLKTFGDTELAESILQSDERVISDVSGRLRKEPRPLNGKEPR